MPAVRGRRIHPGEVGRRSRGEICKLADDERRREVRTSSLGADQAKEAATQQPLRSVKTRVELEVDARWGE